MQDITAFAELVDAADKLSLDEQAALVEILQRRMVEHRRAELVKEIREAEQEYQAGGCRPVTPDELSNPRGLSVAATLRGFYDDNPFTLPNGQARSTYGTEISPAAAFNHTFENTTVTLSYIFDWLYYLRTSTSDMSHQFSADVRVPVASHRATMASASG